MTDDKYVFMWASEPIIPSYWASPAALKDRSDILFPCNGLVHHFDGKIITAYMKEQELEHTKQKLSIEFLKKDYYDKFVLKFNKEHNTWWSWIREIEKKDYSKTNRPELLKDHKKFNEFQRDAIAYFGGVRCELTFAAEEKLKSYQEQNLD